MSTTFKLSDDFLKVPKLSADGSNFHIWKDKLILACRVRGIEGYLDGTAAQPADPPTRSDFVATATPDEVSQMETHQNLISDWKRKEAIVLQQIVSTIPDALYLKIKGKAVKDAWKLLMDDFGKRSRMFTIDLRRRLQDIRCEDNGNIRTHFDTLRNTREELASLGEAIPDRDFAAIILGSLPKSYDAYLSAITATLSVLQKELDPDALVLSVIDEYDRRNVKTRQAKDKGKDAAFYAGGGSKNPKGGRGGRSNVECHNCHKIGHKKADCWGKGGGKEGQGPRTKAKKEEKDGKSSAEAGHTAEDEDGVWMAAVDDSGDEDTVDDVFGEYEGSEIDDWYYFAQGWKNLPLFQPGDEEDVESLHGNSTGPYDDMPDLQSCSDTSSDEDDAAALHVASDSNSEISIDPYWSSIKIDELQGLGKPNIIPGEENESVPSLISDMSTHSSIPSLITPSDSSEDGDISMQDADQFEYNIRLTTDHGEDGYSTFDCAMLVNVKGSVEGVETELYDSGASRHMSPYRDRMENYVSIIPKSITAADKRYFQAIGKGDLRIKIPNGNNSNTSILLKDVLHCPDMGLTLVSIGKIAAAGYHTLFRGPWCRIYDTKNKLVGQLAARNGLYRVDHDIAEMAAMGVAGEVLTLEDLHRRMGHIAPTAAQRMIDSGAIKGIELDSSSSIKSCYSCEYAKSTRKPIKRAREEPRAEEFGGEVHSDLWGKSPVQTPGHKEYYVSFTDDYSRWTYLKLLATKDETFEAYKAFESWANTHHNSRIKRLRSDRGGEYLGGEFSKYLAQKGTTRILTTHDTPEYNGVSERLNRTLLERTRAMLHASKLPKNLWGEAINHAVWLKNRTPTKSLPNGKTPYEMLYKKKPDLSGLREWGAWVWVHDSTGSKLDGRSQIGRWVGFDSESTGAHRIYWGNGKVSVERNVKFNDNNVPIETTIPLEGENAVYDGNSSLNNLNEKNKAQSEEPAPVQENNTPETGPDYQIIEPTEELHDSAERWLGKPFNRVTDSLSVSRSQRLRKPSAYVRRIQEGLGVADNRPSQPDIPIGVQKTSGTTNADIEGEPDTRESEGIEAAMAAAVAEAEAIEPITIGEAKRRPDWAKWKQAVEIELDVLKKNNTWRIVERPNNRNVVQCKWVFKIKKDADGRIERYKARLVAKGFTQVQDVDYYETWAPVAKLSSIRTVLAIAARNGWPIDMFDFHSAFLNGELDANEEVYMEQPPDHEESNPREFCLRLNKSIYGLKQAGRKWYDVICQTFANLGFKRSEYDPAVFYIHSDGNIIIMAIHVDDCTITGNNKQLLQDYKEKIKSKYSLTDLGPVNWLLGIKITRNLEAKTIGLSQASYIDSILTRFNFTDAKTAATPMDPSIHFSKDQCPQNAEETADMRKVPYREAIGSLMYCAVATRPDIAFSVSLLAQFMENPGRTHWEAVKRVFRYLKGTKDWKLVYGTEEKGLEGYTDADGSSQEHRHAISGYAFLIDGGAVSWSSKKQELVTLSTAESEYVAATHAAKEALWLRRFIGEIFRPFETPLTLYCDSQSAIALTKEGSYHARTKHIDIRYHFIRFIINDGSILLVYCPTEEMAADTLTKALPSIKAKHFATSLGLRST